VKKQVNISQPCNNGQQTLLMNKKKQTRQISYDGSQLSQRLALAIQSVKVDGVSVRQAAKDYDVTRQSLQRRINGEIALNARPGRMKYFSDSEEKEIKNWIFSNVDQGFPISRRDVIVKAIQLLKQKGMIFYYFLPL